MKRILLFLAALFLLVNFSAGTTVTIGTGTLTSQYPLDDSYSYSRSQALYLSSEIGTPAGSITCLRWYRGNTGSDPNAIGITEIWLSETTNTVLTGAGWEDPGTLVASISNIDLGSGGGWLTVPITAFTYTGGNLLVSTRAQNAPAISPQALWRYTGTASNFMVRQGSSNTVNPPGMALSTDRPNIQLEVILTALDFGDAPDPSYPTLFASNGARHRLDGITFLGSLIDAETNGQPSAIANGDDNNNLADEDGVTFLWPLAAGNPCKIKVTASVGGAFLNAWIDFNINGSWADAGEQVFTNKSLIAGDNYLTFIAPSNVVPGQSFARFRFSHQQNLSYTGYASDGEVEDYAVSISEFGNIKWQQSYDVTLPGLHSDQAGWEADDWICSGGQVTYINWWGNYELDAQQQEERGQGINHFLIKIYSNAAGLPGTVLQTYSVPFTSITELNTGFANNENCPVYYYQYELVQPFGQTQGTVYWVSIQAISNNPLVPFNAEWRWQEANRWYDPISNGSASYVPGSQWITNYWAFPPPGLYSEMAFIISSQVQIRKSTSS